jgi:three-Cys-motif partner protein
MSSKRPDTVWKAEPHTIAKINLLRAYLKAWLSILGISRRGEQILYVDGFAGPGEYTNYQTGSPIAAIEAANSVLGTHDAKWIAGDIHCAFIDADDKRVDNLTKKVNQILKDGRIRTYIHAATFVDGLALVKKEVPKPFTERHPLFVFVDPFGATGFPFQVMQEILVSPCSEVLINLDADGIDRIFNAGDAASREKHLTDLFGSDCWRTELALQGSSLDRCKSILDLYKRRLRTIPGVRYVFAFEMRSRAATLNYYLVFASQHRLGLEKMKEAMRSVDQSGEFSFCDASVGQVRMFQKDANEEIKEHAGKWFALCKGKRILYQELVDYALNETPYKNPKGMLISLEDQELLAVVETYPGTTRRKRTFDEKVVVAVTFAAQKIPRLFD